MGTTAYPLFYSEILKMWELLSLLILDTKKLNIKCNSHKTTILCKNLIGRGFIEIPKKIKPQKQFLFAVLFKGTKKF
ncbi:hypothetical protein LEP1GSC021_0283 [Leptospira noguchii str. 1993005606]|uniref:Uncharacterized protein n=1 Tax=Leptospira noguchii str. 2007001578 TaxID=1049974 RepID=A0ABP2TGV9_9LEPT|nr:hypothetical protein LEP1GSC035_2543 [Leptospira noguchii str. 2007001578]EPE84936.1 hypothetical protein LEP1GSC021_0283 [Leptospira noguchii str. 1993005606]